MSLETIDSKLLPQLDDLRVLDLGCGEGRHAISTWVYSNAMVTGIDLSLTDLKTARQRMSDFKPATTAATDTDNMTDDDSQEAAHRLVFVQGSGLQLPFADHSFDVVICSEVLEHIDNYSSVLREIERVLVPGGTFAMSVPRFGPEWVCWQLSRAYHEVPGGHLRIFNAKALKREIETFDFACYAKHWAHALHSPYWWLKCLFWSSADDNRLVRAYHRFLVWDLMQQPRVTRLLERCLNPLFGKSVAMYFKKLPASS